MTNLAKDDVREIEWLRSLVQADEDDIAAPGRQ